MTKCILKIRWSNSVEYIAFDLSSAPNETDIETFEIWDSGKRIAYVASCTRSVKQGRVNVALDYTNEANALAAEWEGADLGISRIIFSSDLSEADVEWESIIDPVNYSGRAIDCKVIAISNADEKRDITRAKRTAIERPGQALLREMLLAIDACCAVSEERTATALEAAHVKAVADGGTDSISNCILLRADLHRLYDAGVFRIEANGRLRVIAPVSDTYMSMLEDARIPESVIARIQSILQVRDVEEAPSAASW